MAAKKTTLAKGFASGAPGAPLTRRERSFVETGKAAEGGGAGDVDRIGSIYLPRELATELRVRCAANRQSLSSAIGEGVKLWLASAKAP